MFFIAGHHFKVERKLLYILAQNTLFFFSKPVPEKIFFLLDAMKFYKLNIRSRLFYVVARSRPILLKRFMEVSSSPRYSSQMAN